MIDIDTARLLSDSVAAFARPDQTAVRALRDAGRAYDRADLAFMGAQGWLGVALSESLGGAALGLGGAVAVARPMGQGLRGEPLASAVFASLCLGAVEPGPRLQAMAKRLCDGDLVVAALVELEAGATGVTAERVGADYRLTGCASRLDPGQADVFLLLGRCPDGDALLALVAAGDDGVGCKLSRAADGAPLAELQMTQVSVAGEQVLATGPAAERIACRALDGALVVVAAELLGLMDRVLDITLEYLRARVQFGRPIGAFQALQHRAVDLWVQRELTEAAVAAAARAFDAPGTPEAERSALASAAKARASAAALTVASQAVQLHGAIGITDEYELSLHLNRALRCSAQFGNALLHRRRYARFAAASDRS